jgi:hypothetical protein
MSLLKNIVKSFVYPCIALAVSACISGCIGSTQTASLGSPTISSNVVRTTTIPLDIQANPPTNPVLVSITVQTKALSNSEVGVVLRATNVNTDVMVVPVKIQFETNNLQIPVLLRPADSTLKSTNTSFVVDLTSTTKRPHWLWAVVSAISVILCWLVILQLNSPVLAKALAVLNIPMKGQGQLDREMPSRLLSGACAIVALIHFYNSDGKADWVLLGLLALGALPWMGKVFKSITKEGVVFQGDVPAPEEPPPARLTGATPPPPPERPTTSQGDEAPATIGDVKRIAGDAIGDRFGRTVREIQNRFGTVAIHFSTDERKIVATLWKYQKLHFPSDKSRRWTFTVSQEAPDFPRFSRGLTELARKQLVAIAPNGQVMLTNGGLAFCERNNADISTNWTDTYDQFSN